MVFSCVNINLIYFSTVFETHTNHKVRSLTPLGDECGRRDGGEVEELQRGVFVEPSS